MTPKKKESVFARIFLKPVRVRADGKEVRGLNLLSILLILTVIFGGLAVLEWCGALDTIAIMIRGARR